MVLFESEGYDIPVVWQYRYHVRQIRFSALGVAPEKSRTFYAERESSASNETLPDERDKEIRGPV